MQNHTRVYVTRFTLLLPGFGRASLGIHATEFWHTLGVSGKASHGIHATESPHSVGENYIRSITMDLLRYPGQPPTVPYWTFMETYD